MKTVHCALSIILSALPVFACTSLTPKNPVKAAAVCGYVQGLSGDRLADFDLQLVQKDNTVLADVHTDTSGNFRFAQIAKGEYQMTTSSKGWQLGWPLLVTGSKTSAGKCTAPLIVHPALNCGGAISKKGYHAKF